MRKNANKRGAGKGGIAVLRRAERAWPALPDRERWPMAALMKILHIAFSPRLGAY